MCDWRQGVQTRRNRLCQRALVEDEIRNSLSPALTTMTSALHSRLRHSARLFPSPLFSPANHPSPSSTVFTRRAMMSALRSPQQPHVPRSPSPLPETTPVVLPEGLSNDAASPQVAARPPPAPKAEKPRPRIRSTKAALTIVSVDSLHPLFLFTTGCLTDYLFLSHTDADSCITNTRTAEWSNPTTHTHWSTE